MRQRRDFSKCDRFFLEYGHILHRSYFCNLVAVYFSATKIRSKLCRALWKDITLVARDMEIPVCPFYLTRCKFDLTWNCNGLFETPSKSSDCLAPNTYLSLFFVHAFPMPYSIEFKIFLQVFFQSGTSIWNYFIPRTAIKYKSWKLVKISKILIQSYLSTVICQNSWANSTKCHPQPDEQEAYIAPYSKCVCMQGQVFSSLSLKKLEQHVKCQRLAKANVKYFSHLLQ